MDRYLVNVPIIRKHFNETSSCKFKGNLQFVSNKWGVIYDWKINFTYVELDIYTTPKWFDYKESQNSNFKRRKLLFDKLGFVQEKRPSTKSNKLVNLSFEQLEILNNFFNDRSTYDSTIKNIVAVLKGNNPGGEAQNPSSAEMIIDTTETIRNFVILLDDLVMKHKINFDVVAIGSKTLQLNEFIKLNVTIESAFNFMQHQKDNSSFLIYLNNIKEYYHQYNEDWLLADRISKQARSRFSNNVDLYVHDFPFGFISKDEFEKCHIYEFHSIRDKIIEAIRSKESYDHYLKMIEDHNNFLPLSGELHRKFDRNYFTYKPDGTILPISDSGQQFISRFVDDKFKLIPSTFLNENRKKYLIKRNKEIGI